MRQIIDSPKQSKHNPVIASANRKIHAKYNPKFIIDLPNSHYLHCFLQLCQYFIKFLLQSKLIFLKKAKNGGFVMICKGFAFALPTKTLQIFIKVLLIFALGGGRKG